MNSEMKDSQSNKEQPALSLSPLDSANRLHHIDSLRGFALFGIFLVNMLAFQYGMFGHKFIYPALNIPDRASHNMIEFLFQGSFYPIFSILFGFGATLMWERSKTEGRPFYSLFVRRLIILALIGVAHLYLIWDGDILFTYAITGFIFLLFLKCKPKTLLTWIFVLVFLNTAPGLLPAEDAEAEADDTPSAFASIVEEEGVVLSEGTYFETIEFRLTSDPFEEMEFGYFISIANAVTMFMQTLWLFLLGAYLVKKRLLHRVIEHQKVLLSLTVGGIATGLLLKGIMVFAATDRLDFVGYIFGGPVLGIGYLAGFSLLYFTMKSSWIFDRFRYVGRMALTNYIVQSLIMTTVFYGYGFGLFGELGTTLGIFLVIGIFIAQIFVSKWWLDRFRFGPLEWLWRNGTYLKKQPLRKNTKQSFVK